ncbi:MAG: glycosyltransferase, partial [Deltaproteobacteria bacterium]|nr:glycosyltransferase [Deltaproteobacteria bacterium]
MAGFLASILIPCYNEAANLPACLASLFAPELAEECQWLIIDGRSTDQTPAVARDLSGRIPNLTLIDNPLRLQAHGLNQGLRQAQGRYIIRADAHSLYPPDYIKNLIALLKETGAWNAGGRMKPKGQSPFQRAVARAMSHPLGVGDARFHLCGFKGPVDTVYLGAFPAWVFERVGPFDPAAHPNEAAELNLRIRLAGGTIFLDGAIEVA